MENRGKKILIIEDEEGLVLSLRTLLKSQGYEVIVAYDATFGTSLAYKEKPDLIILDLGLPAGGGFSVLKNVKISIFTQDIPTMVLTSNPLKESEERAYALGAAVYLQKPYDPPELLKKIKETIGGAAG
ncbi:MAG: response regulator [Candidatus Omnitrophota bacterium]